MRIVDRATFLTLPAGTIFAKFGPQPWDGRYVNLTHEDVCIKGETVGGDFVVQELFPWFQGCHDSETYHDALERMLAGQLSPPLDYHYDGRDGLFDQDQLFAVWEVDDAARLVARLHRALAEGYGVNAIQAVTAMDDAPLSGG